MNEHVSVLLKETIDGLEIQAGSWYVDATFGRGGHTRQILTNNGRVIAFDVDAQAIEFGEKEFADDIAQGRLILLRMNFDRLKAEIQSVLSKNPIHSIQGILFDFGVSSPQLDQADRGFSFQHDVELDMRMDDRLGVKAKDLLALLPEKQLAELFIEFGGEHESFRIAKAIVNERKKQAIATTHQLAGLIEKTKKEKRGHLNPATKVFQALRIAVNSELDSIQSVLPQALDVLANQGHIVVISFHEGEDRLVKTAFKNWQQQGLGEQVNKQVITPTEEEVALNSRSRSAKLRVFKKENRSV